MLLHLEIFRKQTTSELYLKQPEGGLKALSVFYADFDLGSKVCSVSGGPVIVIIHSACEKNPTNRDHE